MPIVGVETLRPAIQPNLCYVRLTDADGVTGLGEAFYGAGAVESHVHDALAPLLLGADPTPEAFAVAARPYVGYASSGVETRALGAVDIALWDLLGRRSGLPLARLLGGPVRESVRAYNTCAGSSYVSTSGRQESSNWGVGAGEGRYEDLQRFLTDPVGLARELVGEGVRAMKVWPFDAAAEASGGLFVDQAGLDAGVRVVASIKEALGADMDVAVELHGLWQPAPAARICAALEPWQPLWVEDPVRPDAVAALASLRERTGVAIASGETLAGRRASVPLLADGLVDVLTLDVGWSGGITEARRTAGLADTFGVAVAPHDCTGPVALAVATHLTCSAPNGLVQETVRAFCRTWYPVLADGVVAVVDGHVRAGSEPGHGVQLRDDDPAAGWSRRLSGRS